MIDDEFTIDDAIFEFEFMASDKCNGKSCEKYLQLAEWLKELKELKNDGQRNIITRQVTKNSTSNE